MITSRQEFFRLLLEGKALVKEELETGIKYFISYDENYIIPYECKFKKDNQEFQYLSEYLSTEEYSEWLWYESTQYNKWDVLENE